MCKHEDPFRTACLGVLLAATMLATLIALSPVATTPAYAWRIVFDPSNYAQNAYHGSANARNDQSPDHLASERGDDADQSGPQSRGAFRSPRSSSFSRMFSARQLLTQAQNIAFGMQRIDQAFQQQYGNVSMSATDQQLVSDRRSRWRNTVGLQDAMRVQAGVVSNIDTNRTQMSESRNQSQARPARFRRRRPATSALGASVAATLRSGGVTCG